MVLKRAVPATQVKSLGSFHVAMESSENAEEPSREEPAGSEGVNSGLDNSTAREVVEPNPFWSDRAADEFRLQRARPLRLAEYDDQQPEYGSEAGHSAGFASIAAPRGRVASSPQVRASDVRSEARASDSGSNGPSAASRSRSPVCEDLSGFQELLVTLGGAVAGLVEEHRNTQQRLARVEENRSGSTSTMRTGRERSADPGLGPQYFAIGDEERDMPRGLRILLPLEDWVQEPLRLQDVPFESDVSGPLSLPVSYGPSPSIRGLELGEDYRGVGLDPKPLKGPLNPAEPVLAQVSGVGVSAQGQEVRVRFGPSAQVSGVGVSQGQEVRFGPSAQVPGVGLRDHRPRHKA